MEKYDTKALLNNHGNVPEDTLTFVELTELVTLCFQYSIFTLLTH